MMIFDFNQPNSRHSNRGIRNNSLRGNSLFDYPFYPRGDNESKHPARRWQGIEY
jgi:hypothetical protein